MVNLNQIMEGFFRSELRLLMFQTVVSLLLPFYLYLFSLIDTTVLIDFRFFLILSILYLPLFILPFWVKDKSSFVNIGKIYLPFVYHIGLFYIIYINNYNPLIVCLNWISLGAVSITLRSVRNLNIYHILLFLLHFLILFHPSPKFPIASYFIFNMCAVVIFYIYTYITITGVSDVFYNKNKLYVEGEELETLFNGLSTLVAYKDTKNRYIRVNKQFAAFHNKPQKFFENRALEEIVGKELAFKLYERDLAVINKKIPVTGMVEEIHNGEGKKMWIRSDLIPVKNSENEVTGLLLVAFDITHEKLMADLAQMSEERFQRIYEEAPNGIVVTDNEKNIIRCNQAFCELLGYEDEIELIGLNTAEISHLEDQRLTIDLAKKAVANGTNRYRIEKRFMSKSGEVVFVDLSVVILLDENGEPSMNLGMMLDITHTKKANKMLKKYATDLEQSNKDLELFAYAASHDLREPLRMITSYIGLFERQYGKQFDENAKEYMWYISDGAKRMNQFILDLLEYSRLGRVEGSKKLVQLNDIVEMAQNNLTMSIKEKEASLEVESLPQVFGNTQQLLTLFQNLISNGLKYSSPERNPKIIIRHTKANVDSWQIEVRDNGIGIEEKNIKNVFGLFSRFHTGPKVEGTGIGLALCKKIIEQQGGTIWVESKPGIGSSFFFTLPVFSDQPRAAAG